MQYHCDHISSGDFCHLIAQMMAEVHTIKNIISETHHSELLSEGPAVAAAAVVTVSLILSNVTWAKDHGSLVELERASVGFTSLERLELSLIGLRLSPYNLNKSAKEFKLVSKLNNFPNFKKKKYG